MNLLSGNEAIARAAFDAGATVGVAYPGTPSTETMEAFATFEGVYAEWCTNEKVAVEVGLGAAASGVRVLATMKHVGLNVAADPLFTASYTGVNGGFVILAADDPGMYSSQNEQDSQFYGQAALVPVLSPSDAQEAYDFTRDAYGLSERFDVPVIIRSSVRISHTKTRVEVREREAFAPKAYESNPAKWVMMPAFAKPRRLVVLKRVEEMRDWVETCPYNRQEMRDRAIGIVCAGASYQHVREALPDASVLKLGVTWPLPEKALRAFEDEVDRVYVIEEGSDYLTQAVKATGVTVHETPRPLSRAGELSPGAIRTAFGIEEPPHRSMRSDLPGRPPALCPGCPHRLVFRELSRLRAIVTGDIGCYTLGALPPLGGMDTCVCMGASVSMAHGFELGLKAPGRQDSAKRPRPVVAVIGDSTFMHSGLSSLVSTIYNAGAGTVCILDNRTTAMTGRQGNPANGVTLQHRTSHEIDLEAVVRACGADAVSVVDPQDAAAVRSALKEATSNGTRLDVIIFKSPCVLLERKNEPPFTVTSACTGCGVCATLGCPAIASDPETGLSSIDPVQCCGCGQCAQYCRFDAIKQD